MECKTDRAGGSAKHKLVQNVELGPKLGVRNPGMEAEITTFPRTRSWSTLKKDAKSELMKIFRSKMIMD